MEQAIERNFTMPVSADPAADSYRLISVGAEIRNADYMIERYENLKKHTTDPRLLRHYNYCINKAWMIRARVFCRIII